MAHVFPPFGGQGIATAWSRELDERESLQWHGRIGIHCTCASVPTTTNSPSSQSRRTGYQSVKDGIFLSQNGACYKLAQVYATAIFPTVPLSKGTLRREILLSDLILYHLPTALILLITVHISAEDSRVMGLELGFWIFFMVG